MSTFPQDDGSSAAAGLVSAGMCMFVIGMVFLALPFFIGMWRVFTKAGRPGWAALIPFYSFYVLLKIAGKPGWWLILLYIPLVNIFIMSLMMVSLANAFGKGGGFAFGLILSNSLFLLILGLSSAQYIGAERPLQPALA